MAFEHSPQVGVGCDTQGFCSGHGTCDYCFEVGVVAVYSCDLGQAQDTETPHSSFLPSTAWA